MAPRAPDNLLLITITALTQKKTNKAKTPDGGQAVNRQSPSETLKVYKKLSYCVLSVFLTGFYAATSLSLPAEKCCSPAAIVAVTVRTKIFVLER